MKKLLPLQNDSQVGIQALADCQEEITLDNRKSHKVLFWEFPL